MAIERVQQEKGWPNTEEHAASWDAYDRDLIAIEQLDNRLTRHPATSVLVQHAALMVAFVEWWHVRLCARVAHALPALARRSAPLPPCLMAIVGSYCGRERCRECSRLSAHTCEDCRSCFCDLCWYWWQGPRPRSRVRCWRCWDSAWTTTKWHDRELGCKLARKLELRAQRPKPPKPPGCAMEKLKAARKERLRALRQRLPTRCAREKLEVRNLAEDRYHQCPRHYTAGQKAGPHWKGQKPFHCGCCAGTCEICLPLPRCRCAEWAHMGWRCFCQL